MSVLRNIGALKGHSDWVTSISCCTETPNQIVSGSRDKSIMVWDLEKSDDVAGTVGAPKRRMNGHENFVSDVAMSGDGKFVFSGSWDNTARLWEIESGKTTNRFVSHTKRVLSVAFSQDNRMLVTGSQDRSVRVWNILGECKETISGPDCHDGWVNAVRMSTLTIGEGDAAKATPIIISGGADGLVRVHNTEDDKALYTFTDHKAPVNCIDVAPDGSLCAAGAKDGKVMLWNLKDGSKVETDLDAEEEIFSLTFAPVHFWLVAGTSKGIRIWDLTNNVLVHKEDITVGDEHPRECRTLSVCWNHDGSVLYSGHDDSMIRAWQVEEGDSMM